MDRAFFALAHQCKVNSPTDTIALMKLTTLFLLAFTATTFAAPQWNQWRGPNRNGLDPNSPPLISKLPDDGLKPVWSSETIPSGRDGGWSSPVVANGKLYVYVHARELKPGAKLPKRKFPWLAPDKRGHLSAAEYRQYEIDRRNEDEMFSKFYGFYETLWCIDAANGKTVWKNRRESVYTRFVQSPTPTVVNGKAYVQGAGRKARCIDANTGKDLWETRMPGEFRDQFMMSSFAVTDGVAAVLAGHLFAFDANTGSILWQGHPRSTRGTHTSPTVWNNTFIVNVGDRETACFEPKSGKEKWRIKSWAGLSTPVVTDNLMITFGSSRRGGVRCFELSDSNEPKHRWTVDDIADKGSSPVVVNDHVFVQGDTTLGCIDIASGKLTWQTKLGINGPQYTSLVAADGKILYTYGMFLWFEANPKKYTPLAQAKLSQSGIIASKNSHWRRLKLDQESDPKKAQKLYNADVGKVTPLQCASPAFDRGRVFLRLRKSIACYDLNVR